MSRSTKRTINDLDASSACPQPPLKRFKINGYCRANYPKDFIQFTQATEYGYPEYRRRSPKHGGFKATIKISKDKTIKIDNRWVLPYNPYLLQKYQANEL